MSTHYDDVIMGAIASQITSLTIVYSTVYSDADQRKHQSSASLAFVRGFQRGPVNSPHKCPVTRKMFPFDDVIMHSVSNHRPLDCLLNSFVRVQAKPKLRITGPLGQMDSFHKGPVMLKAFPCHSVINITSRTFNIKQQNIFSSYIRISFN